MTQQRDRSQAGKALGVVGVGLASAAAVIVVGLHALAPPSTSGGSPNGPSAPASSTPTGPARVPPMPNESPSPLAEEGGLPGDVEEQSFYVWAATRHVGSLNLAGMDPSTGLLAEVATGYCNLLSEEPIGSGRAVVGIIRRQTGASPAEARELLERSVRAFCPQKARHLV